MIAWNWKHPTDSIIRLLQKIFRGYSDAELWNLYVTFAKFILPRLRRYRKMDNTGYPTMIMADEDVEEYSKCGNTLGIDEKDLYYEKKWNTILDKMITAFGLILREDDPHSNNVDSLSWFENWIKAEEIKQNKIKEGLQLFAKYFQALWD